MGLFFFQKSETFFFFCLGIDKAWRVSHRTFLCTFGIFLLLLIIILVNDAGSGQGDFFRKKKLNLRPVPTDDALLINFLLGSDAEIFVNKHRLSMRIGAQTCKNVHAMCAYSDWASIFARHHWWLGAGTNCSTHKIHVLWFFPEKKVSDQLTRVQCTVEAQ